MMTAEKLEAARKKSPSGGLGGLGAWTGLLIFETKTHPATVDIMIGRRIGFHQSPEDKGGTHIVAR
jgi:hypothetical protein